MLRTSATENWSGSAQGASLSIQTVANGTTTLREVAEFSQNGLVSLPADPVWITSFSPTLSAGIGTFTTATISARYRRLGRMIFLHAVISITDKGTADGDIRFTLPDNDSGVSFAGVGRENAINGKTVSVVTATSIALINNYDNTTPIVNGASISLTILYEADGAS
jgi:hypothetical protein